MSASEEDLMNGLQMPKEPAKEPKAKAKEIILEAKLTDDQIKAREGTYFSEKDVDEIIDEDADVYAKDPDAPDGKKLS